MIRNFIFKRKPHLEAFFINYIQEIIVFVYLFIIFLHIVLNVV